MTAWDAKSPLSHFAMVVPRGSPYHSTLYFTMLQVIETGIVEREFQKWLAPEPNCQPISKTADPLDFNKMVGIFIWLGAGVFLTIIIFCGELTIKKPTPDISSVDIDSTIMDELEESGIFQDLKGISHRLETTSLLRKRPNFTLNELLDLTKKRKRKISRQAF